MVENLLVGVGVPKQNILGILARMIDKDFVILRVTFSSSGELDNY